MLVIGLPETVTAEPFELFDKAGVQLDPVTPNDVLRFQSYIVDPGNYTVQFGNFPSVSRSPIQYRRFVPLRVQPETSVTVPVALE